MKKITAILLALAGLMFPALVWAEDHSVRGSIESDATWSPEHNPYLVQSDVTVEKGAVLTIKPGTQICFSGNSNLVVKGGMEALGDETKPIYFMPVPGAKTWGTLLFSSSDPKHSVLARCVIAGGRVGILASSPLIEQCTLYGSAYALQIGANSNPMILGNRLTSNQVGLVLTSDSANPTVMKNVIYNNQYGILFQDFGSPKITGNHIYGNQKYNMVNRSPKPVSAPWNDYRIADATAISKSLYDGAVAAGMGRIQFMPFAPPVETRETRVVVASNNAWQGQSKISFTLSGLYANASGASVPSSQKMGLGNLLRIDYQFRPFMSIGVNLGYASFMSNGKSSTLGQLDLVGRVMPFASGFLEPYFMGGAGINPFFDPKNTPWVGRYHATAGLGTKFNLDSGWGMDLAGVYDFYTPMAQHIDSFSVRLGVSYAIGL